MEEKYEKLRKAYEHLFRARERIFKAPIPLPDGAKALDELKEARRLIEEILKEEKVKEVV